MQKFLLLYFFPILVFAQIFGDDPGQVSQRMMQQQGQLVSVRMMLGEPIRIFVVGREEAKLDSSQMKLTVRRLKPYPGKVLSVNQQDEYYTITDPVDLKKETDLEVTATLKNKSETLRFKIENKKP